MKHRFWLLVPVALALTGAAAAQDIHKCIAGNAVAYQNAPCVAPSRDAGVLRLPGYADPPQRDGAMSPSNDPVSIAPSDMPVDVSPSPTAPDTKDAFPFRTSIALGMTDDQVLNIPHWGRPSRIVRSGRHERWRETWTYDRNGETRELAFVDGRLAGIADENAPIQIATAKRTGAPL
ncbi:MAG TPA: hypothetical protein VN858_00120 [Casimicrobiaceae bacterium]|jgi:hypothetical protein|nr:hypothetical protein [Casimicrobiaceae bacterium]